MGAPRVSAGGAPAGHARDGTCRGHHALPLLRPLLWPLRTRGAAHGLRERRAPAGGNGGVLATDSPSGASRCPRRPQPLWSRSSPSGARPSPAQPLRSPFQTRSSPSGARSKPVPVPAPLTPSAPPARGHRTAQAQPRCTPGAVVRTSVHWDGARDYNSRRAPRDAETEAHGAETRPGGRRESGWGRAGPMRPSWNGAGARNGTRGSWSLQRGDTSATA